MRPHQIALLALASTALLFACGDDDDDNTPVTVDLNGTWSFTVDVTVANGVCAGEEDNPVTPFPVEVSITT